MEMFFIFFGGMCTLILILEFVPVLIKKISTSSKIQKTKFLSDSEISNFDCTLNNKLINDIVVNLYSIYRNAYTSLNLDVLKKVCNYEIVNSIENEFKILDIIIPFNSKVDINIEYLGTSDIKIDGGIEKVIVYLKTTEPTIQFIDKRVYMSSYRSTSSFKITLFRQLNSNSFIIDSFEAI